MKVGNTSVKDLLKSHIIFDIKFHFHGFPQQPEVAGQVKEKGRED